MRINQLNEPRVSRRSPFLFFSFRKERRVSKGSLLFERSSLMDRVDYWYTTVLDLKNSEYFFVLLKLVYLQYIETFEYLYYIFMEEFLLRL